MNPHSKNDTQTSDRRRHSRRPTKGIVRLTVDKGEIEGVVENISRSGLLFFSESDLRVTVQVEDNGATITRKGRLVRAQRMRGESFGWAIEFD